MLIEFVIMLKKIQQGVFLAVDTIMEEFPTNNSINQNTYRIHEDQLGADGPPEPTDISRMAGIGVNSVCYQLMSLILLMLHLKDSGSYSISIQFSVMVIVIATYQMCETLASRYHGYFPYNFPKYAHSHTD